MNLNEEEKESLRAWISHEIQSKKFVDDSKTETLCKYIIRLLDRDISKERLFKQLNNLLKNETDSFIDELLNRIAQKDFAFKEETTKPEQEKKIDSHEKKSTETTAIKPSPKPAQSQKKDDDKSAHKHANVNEKTKYEGKSYPNKNSSSINKNQNRENTEPKGQANNEEKIRIKTKEQPKRHIIFAAGIDPNLTSISHVYQKFTKFGKILGIEIDTEQRVLYVEFDEFLSAFKATKSNQKKSLLDNTFIKIDYAIPPDPAALQECEETYQNLKQSRRNNSFNSQPPSNPKAIEDQSTVMDEEESIRKRIENKLQSLRKELEEATDPEKKEEIENNIKQCNGLLASLLLN